MKSDAIKKALLESYAQDGGINHLDGVNLPSQDSVSELARDLMHVLFPGYFESSCLAKDDVPAWLDRLLAKIDRRLATEVEKSLRFARDPAPAQNGKRIATELFNRLPEIRRVVQTDVQAAYTGDPAARSIEEIILAYPCVLAISLQRIAHELYRLGVPLLPRMLTEYGHERTGIDLHPGATIGTHFFIDHGTGVVIGESATIGNHVKLYQGVTLGAKSFEVDNAGNPVKGTKRHPDIGDHVTIYAHATILGGDTRIGEHSVIGGNVWLLESMPAHSIAYYKGDDLIVRARQSRESLVGEPADWVI
ncbi:MAG TPA: serine O-acetyltransferase [Lacunisphaera sp.]|jgi:serine O-acetyltransferase|nr:serine O-acetyltransferase [Lacunisphaera sp.]